MTSVLIVDDDAAFRTTIGRDLGAQGFTVSLAKDADEATQLLSGQAIDVLLTDLRMPGEDGIDLLGKVRTVAPRTRAILMSGYASARDYQRAIECGAVRVLSKPFTPSELLQAIRQAVECETGFRGSIHGLSLVDLLQMFHYARRSLAIVVDGLAPGHVFLEDGHVIHAVYRDLQGEPALRAILSMPAGSLRTMVLPHATPHSIARDFQTLLLDTLRTVDEEAAAAASWDFEEMAEPAVATSPELELVVEKLRRLDGYAAAMMIDSQSGVVLGGDGDVSSPEIQAAAAGYCELYRMECALVDRLGVADEIEDVVITMSKQYHVLHAVAGAPSLLLCVALDRDTASLGLARYAIAAADQLARGSLRMESL
ncbi:MAG TPA: response regulator [Kofleriaceae bacterium]